MDMNDKELAITVFAALALYTAAFLVFYHIGTLEKMGV